MIQLHRKYLFTKTNKKILISLTFLFVLTLLIFIQPTKSLRDHWFNRYYEREDYLQNFLLVFQPLFVLVCSYLFGNFFSKQKDNYHLLIDSMGIHRKKYFLTKVLSILEVCVAFFAIIYLAYLTILLTFSPFDIIRLFDLKFFISIFLIAIVYGLQSVFVSLLLPSSFSFLFPYGMFIAMRILGDVIPDSMFLASLSLLFPYSKQNTTGIDFLQIFFLIFSLGWLNLTIYENRQL